MAVVWTPVEIAEKLREKKHITIGASRCPIREWIDVPRCFRCWSYEHYARTCKGIDRTKACLRCAKEGHNAKDCGSTQHCPLCNQDGHTAIQRACPKFREGLAREAGKKSK